ncbi:hypothetical protein B0A52_04755 [Exophiala mesophila]|uniref:Zn(2)-C6 fungal-type domain-containing protein n=1 Tax=Exophiala mesophila TaxID=212818 RepID=A0A438N8Q5_EXOME|nr:hypothetical protein B0A52_04755 [Exophiala mesophila]
MPSPSKARPLKPAQGDQPPEPTSSKKRQSNARISAACEACKKRKTKCTGGPPPCQLCESLKTECIIDLSLDMRRRAALQRTIDESKSFQDGLNDLIDAIRDGPQSDELVRFIRKGATNEDILEASQRLQSLRTVDEPGQDSKMNLDDGGSSSQSGSRPALGTTKFHSDPTSVSTEFAAKESHLHYQTHEPIKSEEPEESSPELWAFLEKLKAAPMPEAERMLHGFAKSQASDSLSPRDRNTTLSGQSNHFARVATAPTYVERATWHPALHQRSPDQEMESPERPSLGGTFQRRFSTDTGISFQNREGVPSFGARTGDRGQDKDEFKFATHSDMMKGLKDSAAPLLPYVEMSNIPAQSPFIASSWDLSITREDGITNLRIPIHLVQPLLVPDDSYLSNMYTDYVRGARFMIQQGTPVSQLLGSTAHIPVDLFFRNREPNDPWDCASWACEIWRSFVEVDGCVRLASVMCLTLMMRWVLSPTLANYQKIPDMMKPTPSQLMIPHIAAIETIPIGPIRDAVIFQLRDWLSELIKASWSVNWPHGTDAAVKEDPLTGLKTLSNDFIDHASRYENWSVGDSFIEAFPELSGRIRVHD